MQWSHCSLGRRFALRPIYRVCSANSYLNPKARSPALPASPSLLRFLLFSPLLSLLLRDDATCDVPVLSVSEGRWKTKEVHGGLLFSLALPSSLHPHPSPPLAIPPLPDEFGKPASDRGGERALPADSRIERREVHARRGRPNHLAVGNTTNKRQHVCDPQDTNG